MAKTAPQLPSWTLTTPAARRPAAAAVSACFDPKRPGGVGAEPPPSSASSLHLDELPTSSQTLQGSVEEGLILDGINRDWFPFEHQGWHDIRRRIERAMMETEVAYSRRFKFAHCGSEMHVYQDATTGELDWRGTRCGDRFCMICGQIRSHIIARSLERLIAEQQPLFITFTVRGLPGDSLQELIGRLNAAWKGLRKLPGWKDKIRGGAMMLEVKWSTESGGHWHPHYHMLADGDWIDQQWLRDAWKVLTGGSYQVDVQRVRDVGKALGYVVKYASKPMDSSYTMRPRLLAEAMRTLKGKRLCSCFGTWYGTPLHDDEGEVTDETEVLTSWVYLGTKRDLERRAEGGDATAKRLLGSLVRAVALRHALAERCASPPKVREPTPSLFESAAV